MNCKQVYPKHILISIFNRRGGKGICTMLFSELAPLQKEVVVGRLGNKLELEEEPILIVYLNSEKWLLVTNLRLVFTKDELIVAVCNNELSEASIDLISSKDAGATTIDQVNYIKITTFSGDKYSLEVESGAALYSIVNVLSSISSKNKTMAS